MKETNLEKRIVQLEEDLSTARRERDEARAATRAELSSRIELEQKSASAVEQLQAQLAELQGQFDAQSKELRSAQAQASMCPQLRTEVAKQGNQIKELTCSIDNLQSEVEGEHALAEEARSVCSELRGRINEITTARDEALESLEKACAQSEELRQEHNEQRNCTNASWRR